MKIKYGQSLICISNYLLQDKLTLGCMYVAQSFSFPNKEFNIVVRIVDDLGEDIQVPSLFFAPMTETYLKRGHLELVKKITE